jgi:FkbM family methyltransferase
MRNVIRSTLISLAYRGIAFGVRVPHSKSIDAFTQWSRLAELTRRLNINVFLDVGANRGFFSKHLRMSGYRGRLISFEPIREDYNQIRRLSRGDPNWTACCYALGSETGSKEFHINLSGDQTVLSSFLRLKEQARESKVVEVEVHRLDEVLPELIAGIISPRIFLKMDTQGLDSQILDGAMGCLDQIVGMQSEVSVIPLYHGMMHYTESLARYEQFGFGVVDLFVVNRREDFVLEYDCILAKPSALRNC